MSNRFLLVILASVAVFVGLLVFNRSETPPVSSELTNHVKGSSELGVTLTEYADFQCTACFTYHPLLQQLKEKYEGRVAFQFRHYPIVTSHPNAMAAHRAAEAAGKQGKFWEMHDKLFESAYVYNEQGQPVAVNWVASSNPGSDIERYAEELGLNIDQYRQDLAARETAASIQADMQSGKEIGVQGTPTFLLNGEMIETPRSIEAFETIIEEALKEASTS